MQIPFVDLVSQTQEIGPLIEPKIKAVLTKGDFILGNDVAEFEKEFSKFCGTSQGVGVASGLDALEMALRAVGVQAGDEVITAANTFIATLLAVARIGAKPVLVDCDPENYNIDPKLIEKAITPKTKAILPVHLYGQPADMDPIMEIAKRKNLFVIEDACQAHGSTYKGRPCGSLGHMSAFSFYPGKNLGAFGDGGFVATNDAALAEKVRMLRNYGQRVKYHHDVLGFNSRLDTIQAAILRVKLQRLAGWNEKRRANAALYGKLLAGSSFVLPKVMPYSTHIYHLFVVRAQAREAVQQFLTGKGISTGIHYPIPTHQTKAFASLGYQDGDFPVTERYAKEILSLPMFPELSEAQVTYVAEAMREFESVRV